MSHAQMKLGKLPPKHDPRTLRLSSYVDLSRLPTPPSSFAWGGRVKRWPMFANDECGDCTIAAAAHMVESWTSDAQHREARVTTHRVLQEYSRLTGYDPATGSNDNGAVELDILRAWRSSGLVGHKIDAFVAVDPRRDDLVAAGMYLFGGLYAGAALPIAAQTQDVWDVPQQGAIGDGAPGSWGGHAIPYRAKDGSSETLVTWGSNKLATDRWRATYVEELYAVFTLEWLTKGGDCPAGFDIEHLRADLALLKAS